MANPTTVPRWERLELIRQMLLQGIAEHKIKRQLNRDGLILPDGRKVKVGKDTLRKDLQQIGMEYRSIADDPLVAERIAGACLERLIRIAAKAETAGKYHAAISANRSVVDLVGRRWVRWRSKGTGEDTPQGPTELSDGLGAMSDAELDQELEGLRGRLQLLDGGSG